MTIDEEFDLMLEKCGVKKYHKKGILGQGINVLNCDNDEHGMGVVNIINKTIPKTNTIAAAINVTTKGDLLLDANITIGSVKEDIHMFVKSHDIHIINASLRGINNSCKEWNEYCKRMQDDTGVIIVNAAGNSYEGNGETLSTMFPHNVAILVGAINITDKRILYSSVGKELDFAMYSGMIGGTSASAPLITGIVGLILCESGIFEPDQLYNYLVSISKDLGTPGVDIYYGNGLPILPEPIRGDEVVISEKIQLDFINKIGPMANADMKKTDILASLTIAQACLESGFGQSGLTKISNNLFGMKGSYNGQTTIASTRECYDGTWVTIQAGFRKYPDWQTSISDHSKLFNTLNRYANLRGCKDYKLACKYVYKDGYATDPDYSSKLISLIEKYNLTKYDKEVEDMTREETLALIKEVLTGSNSTVSGWAEDLWNKGKADGITDGTNPKGYVTREQAVAMIERALK